MKFIIWDPRDGFPRRDEDDNIISDGIIGRVGKENVYLKIYAEYTGDKRPWDLDVNDWIDDVVFSLSGSRGTYDIWRVS